jgi:hypothetical protein
MATRVTGIRLDTAELDRLTAELTPKAERVIKSTAFAVQGEAAKRAPVDTTALATSINAKPVQTLLWRVSDGMEYGIYQELGFHHWLSGRFIQNAFMVPAVEFIRPHFESAWGALFR